MKLRINSFRNSAAVSLAIGYSATSASAVTQYWTGAGEWTDSKWSNATGGPYTQAWSNTTADIAIFEGTGGAVTIASDRNVDRLDFNVTGYSLTAATPVTLTGIAQTNYNLAANVTASIGANVTVQSSSANQIWTIQGNNKATSILNLDGVIRNATASTCFLYDATVNLGSTGQLASGTSIVVGTTTTNKGSDLNVAGTVSLGNNASNLVLNNTAGITADTSITLSSGGAITFTDAANTNGLRFGLSGGSSNAATQLTGTFNLNGGTLTVNKVYMSSAYSAGAAYNATFNFNGGTLKALKDNDTDFMTGLIGTGAMVKSGGAIIDSNGKNVTIGQALLAGSPTGGLEKKGNGRLTLTGANTYTGGTTVSAGTLTLAATGSIAKSATVSVASGATLDVSAKAGGWTVGGTDAQKLTGSGGVTGATIIGALGTHNAGDPAVAGGVGSQAFSSSLNYANSSIFEWDLNANSTASGFDMVSAVGNIDVGTSTVFKVVFGTAVDLNDAFWSTPFSTKQWSMESIFGKVFTSGSFASVVSTANPTTQGSFSIDGTNLTWTAVPEPTSALAGLLLSAGLLRRRRA